MADVVVYTSDFCIYCVRAKLFLNKKQVPFTEINVANDAEKRRWLLETTGQRTVPQIFINDKPIGGFSDMYELDKQGKLDPLLAETK